MKAPFSMDKWECDMERKYFKYILLAGMVLLCLLLFYSCGSEAKKEKSQESPVKQVERDTATKDQYLVYVSGAVAAPGVYELPEGSHVFDAVKAAGDVLPYADVDGVNMAEALHDCEKVYIPLDPNKTSPDALGKININKAGRDELQTLPGVGIKTAEKIIAYREAHGSFKSKEELKEVPTLGEKKYEKLSSKITL